MRSGIGGHLLHTEAGKGRYGNETITQNEQTDGGKSYGCATKKLVTPLGARAGLPEIFPSIAEEATAESNNIVCPLHRKNKKRKWTFENVIERLKSVRRERMSAEGAAWKVVSTTDAEQKRLLDLLKVNL